jgi:hypothetical protein
MRGVIPPLPQYASLAGCSVKAQGQLYLYLFSSTLSLCSSVKVKDQVSDSFERAGRIVISVVFPATEYNEVVSGYQGRDGL